MALLARQVDGEAAARRVLWRFAGALVEDVRGGERPRAPEELSADFQLALPYRGLFLWRVGGDEIVGDANQALFVTGGEAYRLTAPLAEGYAELIVTPSLELLHELAPAPGAHALFRRRARRLDPALLTARARLLARARRPHAVDALAAEEFVIHLLRTALDAGAPLARPSPSALRLLARAKAFLQAELAQPIRLADVARAAGASPAYLTDLFRRVEGAPLHRYLTQLRLSRALDELPERDDLTLLALDCGFSSHSHFSAAFARAFGTPPSKLRRQLRGEG